MTTQPDLFPDAFQDSPYIEFVRRHGIQVVESSGDYAAFLPQDIDDRRIGADTLRDTVILNWREFWTCKLTFIGETQRDAVLELACALGLDGREGI